MRLINKIPATFYYFLLIVIFLVIGKMIFADQLDFNKTKGQQLEPGEHISGVMTTKKGNSVCRSCEVVGNSANLGEIHQIPGQLVMKDQAGLFSNGRNATHVEAGIGCLDSISLADHIILYVQRHVPRHEVTVLINPAQVRCTGRCPVGHALLMTHN